MPLLLPPPLLLLHGVLSPVVLLEPLVLQLELLLWLLPHLQVPEVRHQLLTKLQLMMALGSLLQMWQRQKQQQQAMRHPQLR
jgi:hypothetical protein